MFKKDKCRKCNEKISRKDNFCPNCGLKIKDSEDYGMLGKNDSLEREENSPFEEMFSGFGGGMINKMFSGAMKMIEKELQKEMKKESVQNNQPKSHFELFINGKRITPKQTNISKKQPNSGEAKKKLPFFTEEKIKKFQKLKREEPKVNLKRFGNRIVCEIELPGIKSVEDISILKLENSIEIKAIGKKAYSKILTINSPIMDYSISKDNLILELEN